MSTYDISSQDWKVRDERTMRQSLKTQQSIPVFAYSERYGCEVALFEIRAGDMDADQLIAIASAAAALPKLLTAVEAVSKTIRAEAYAIWPFPSSVREGKYGALLDQADALDALLDSLEGNT